MKRTFRIVVVCMTMTSLVVGSSGQALAISCTSWKTWNYASSYNIRFRACINSNSSTITGKMEAYLDWTGIDAPQFDFLSMTAQVLQEW
jgi:hypothetical protein